MKVTKTSKYGARSNNLVPKCIRHWEGTPALSQRTSHIRMWVTQPTLPGPAQSIAMNDGRVHRMVSEGEVVSEFGIGVYLAIFHWLLKNTYSFIHSFITHLWSSNCCKVPRWRLRRQRRIKQGFHPQENHSLEKVNAYQPTCTPQWSKFSQTSQGRKCVPV